VSCSVAIQQGIERHNRRATQPLEVRVGVSTGEATEEDGDFFGDAVVEASRLCAAAQGHQILTTELVKMMLGRNATHELVPVGDLELKGIPEPVPAVEVRWEPEATPPKRISRKRCCCHSAVATAIVTGRGSSRRARSTLHAHAASA
jgi:class 3 adenylate cyclase